MDPVKEGVPIKEVVPACKEYGDVVLESFQHLEEVCENREKFTLVDKKNRGMISVWDKGKRAKVIMTNCFDSLMEVDKGDKWALSIVDGSPPPLRVDDSAMVLLSTTRDGIPLGDAAPIRPYGSWCSWNVRGLNSLVKCRVVKDFLAVSTVGFCCILETIV